VTPTATPDIRGHGLPLPSPGRAPAAPRRWARALAPITEALLLCLVIAALWPAFQRAAQFGDGRNERFAPRGLEVRGLPEPVLPAACALVADAADALLKERLCSGPRWPGAGPRATLPDAWPEPLRQAAARAARALAAPVAQAQAEAQALRQRQHEGIGDLRALADAAAAIEADTAPYQARFQLLGGTALALQCLVDEAEAAGSGLATSAAAPAARANALLLQAAALDGRLVTGALAQQVALPLSARGREGCAADAAGRLGAAAALMADARQSHSSGRKDEAMRVLLGSTALPWPGPLQGSAGEPGSGVQLPNAGLQWAGAMLLGYLLLCFSRMATRPAPGIAAALGAWALAAWAARVPWPLAGARAFEPARADTSWTSAPAGFVIALALAAVLLALAAAARAQPHPEAGRNGAAQTLSTRLGYPGLALATGVGWLLLLDLSAHAHLVNRYLALYHQGHLWLGMLLFSVMLFARQPLARALARALSLLGGRTRRLAALLTPAAAAVLVGLAALLAVLAFGTLLANLRQLTSELGRVWLIVGAAWFFFLRAGPLARRLAENGPTHVPIARYLWPLLLVVGVLVAAMVLTRDMGPLLIAGYASGAFIGAALAAWAHARGARPMAGIALALAIFALWIAAVTAALFQAGQVDEVTAARLESLAAPLASTNDQLALVTWFQRASPPSGHGLGAVPWCGHAAATAQCSGMPAQVHSDYTFTALVGVWGAAAAWALALGAAFWLHRLVRHHGRVTGGEPRLVHSGGRLVPDGQALLSWIAVGWVVLTLCQLAVTVAGNLAVLPLTGVTFPFVSYGMTSLVINLAFLALCLNVDVRDAR
jgi:cell division protein FtsW (lipid II flippase)